MSTQQTIWKNMILRDVVTFKTGKLNSNAAKPEGKYPFFTCSQETFSTDTFSFDTECVLLGGNNANGIYPLKYFSGKFDAYQRTYIIESLDTSKMLNRYLYYTMQPKLELLKSISTGAATKFLTLTILNDIGIELPPIEQQHKIASILSTYDNLIENNTRRIKILEEMVQLIYHEWFVNFRLPGHEKVKMVESELGMIPMGWQVKTLGEIARINERMLKKGNPTETINYIDISSVSTGLIDNIQNYLLKEAPGRARRVVKHGDIIWSTVRPNRKSYSLILNPIPHLIVSTGFAVVSSKMVPYTYLYQALSTEEFVGYLVNRATGSAYPAVLARDFEIALVLVPPKDILEDYNNYVSPIYDLIHVLQVKNQNLTAKRNILLPRLISREIDLDNLDITIPEED